MTVEERIAAWLAAVPGAVAGQGGHSRTFRVACQLYNGWGLPETEVLRWLQHYNEKCEPAWTLVELKHKAASAAKAEHSKPRGHMVTDGGFRTAAPPIHTPAKDTRLPLKGKLTTGEEADKESVRMVHLKSYSLYICKPTLARICETRKRSVTCVPNGGQTIDPPDENSERSVPCVPKPLTPKDLAEASRIAQELVKLHAAGTISGPNDPEAVFFAHVARGFSATYAGAAPLTDPAPTAGPTAEQIVAPPPPGLSREAAAAYYRADLEQAIGGAEFIEPNAAYRR